ncbi:MAG: hypothetical protein Q8R31_06825 [Candidatus Omnitrophota bacterium]|nr:hypothetical protein [Candidatus Omnitrophota bacterium]
MDRRKFTKPLAAFTLIELVVSTGILLIVISGLLVTFISCILMNESNNNMVIAVSDAQYVLEQIKGLAYNNIDAYTPPTFTNLHNETVPNPNVVEIVSGIKEVTVSVNWTERQREKTFSLSTRIAR